MGVQEFASYALIVDTRSPEAYAEDHVPGAISVPLQQAGRRTQRGRRSRQASPRSRPDHASALLDSASRLRSGDAVLLYGAGADAALSDATASLRDRNLVVDVLAGGWAAYRRWIRAGLEVLPRRFALRVLSTPAGASAERVADALGDIGEQVIDFGACLGADRRIGATRAHRQVLSQSALETWLLDTLRHRETDRILWVAGALELPAALQLPMAMLEALARAPEVRVDPAAPEAIGSQLDRLLLRPRDDDGQSKP